MNLPLRLIAGVLSVLLTDLLVGASLVGLGLSVRRAFGLAEVTLDDGFRAFWVGFAFTLLLLLLWNFVAPIDGRVLPVVLTAGLLGLVAARADVLRALRSDGWRPSRGEAVTMLLGALWVADQSLGPMRNWDSALYHLQGIAWAQSYPVVPGLANLFGPLGFNNGGYLYDAMLNTGPWQGGGYHLANGILVLAMLWQGLAGAFRYHRGQGQSRSRYLFDALLIAPALHVAMRNRLSSYVTDIGPSMVLMVVASAAFVLLTTAVEGLAGGYSVVVIAVLLSLAVCLKMNAAVFAASCLPICLGYWWWRNRGGPWVVRTTAWVAVSVMLFAGAWVTRGVILSGYPLFPSTLLPAPVDWRAPAEHAQAEFAYVVHSGRASTDNIPVITGEVGLRGWVGPWAAHAVEEPNHILVPGLVILLAVGFLVWRRFRGAGRNPESAGWLLAIPIVVAITTWFFSAPEPRYVEPMFWSLAALCTVMAVGAWRAESDPVSRPLLAAVMLLGLTPLVLTPLVKPLGVNRGLGVVRRIIAENIQLPGDSGLFQPIAKHPTVTTYVTRSGLQLNFPPGRCWDAPIPCTPNPAPNLRLRVEGRLDRGFAVDGAWAMEHWPADRRHDFLPAFRRRIR